MAAEHLQVVRTLMERPRLGIAAQATQPVERVSRAAALIRQGFPQPAIKKMNTVCLPTRLRQPSAEELARRAEPTSSSSLAEPAATTRGNWPPPAAGTAREFRVQTAANAGADWLKGAEVTGITANTSALDHVVDDLETRVRASRSDEAAA